MDPAAYQNMMNSLKATGTPTPAPVQPKPMATPAPQVSSYTPAPAPISRQRDNWSTPQGKFFSGNLLQKAFDIPMLPNYLGAGFLKGAYDTKHQQINSGDVSTKTYLQNILDRMTSGVKGILPGIQNRTQFGTEQGNVNVGKELGIKSNTGQSAYNFALSMAMPNLALTKIPGVKQLGKLTGKAANAGANVLRKSESVSKFIENIPFTESFRLPEAGKIINEGNNAGMSRVSGLFNRINDSAKGLNGDQLEEVGRLIEGKGTSTDQHLIDIATQMRTISDKVGQELVDLGIMKAETLKKYQDQGGYLAHIAADVKTNLEKTGSTKRGPLSFFTNSLKERKNILGAEGKPDYIRQFQFPVFKSIGGEMATAESVKSLNQLAEKFGKTEQEFLPALTGSRKTAEGMVSLADVVPQKFAHLFKGIAVPQAAADYVSRTYATKAPELIDKVMNVWKAGKTIVNPGYHVRNILSNLILSDMSTGEGLARTLWGYKNAVNAYKGKGSPQMNQYLQELKDVGVIGRQTMASGMEEFNPNTFTKAKSRLGKVAEKLSPFKFQTANEETSKLNVYSYWRDHGMDVKQAAQKAQEAIFSPYNISKAERSAVRHAIPFYSFTRQALPFSAKTLAENPSRMTKYMKLKTGVESLSPEDTGQNANLPDSIQGQVRLPIKDKYGRSIYADPTYIYPFGNFTGIMSEKGQAPFGLGWNPIITELMSQFTGPQMKMKAGPFEGTLPQGYDQYFQQPIAKSMIPEEAAQQKGSHFVRTAAPSFVSSVQQLYSAIKKKEDYAGRTRNIPQAILNTLGLKSSSFSPEEQASFDNSRTRDTIQKIRDQIRSVNLNKGFTPEEKDRKTRQLYQELQSYVPGK